MKICFECGLPVKPEDEVYARCENCGADRRVGDEVVSLRARVAELEIETTNQQDWLVEWNKSKARVAELEAAHQQIMGICDPDTAPYRIAKQAIKG